MSHNNRNKHCFTLIELLVVIAIIGILAGILMPATKKVWGRGKETRAEADIHALKVAIGQYESSYGYLPDTSSNTDVAKNTGDSTFLDILAGPGNKRNIQFLEPRTDDSGNNVFLDPWRNPYQIQLDTGYNNQVTIPGSGKKVKSSVAIWSYGPNGEDDGGEDDDLTSWQ